MDGWLDGWITCDFTSFLAVFQSYQNDGKMMINDCVHCNVPLHIYYHSSSQNNFSDVHIEEFRYNFRGNNSGFFLLFLSLSSVAA